jgi:hypothetical protein
MLVYIVLVIVADVVCRWCMMLLYIVVVNVDVSNTFAGDWYNVVN